MQLYHALRNSPLKGHILQALDGMPFIVALLIGWPLTSLWAIGVLLGASLLFSGFTTALAIRCARIAPEFPHEYPQTRTR